MMLGLIPNLSAADELPPTMSQHGDSSQAFEAFLFYLAEFEDENGDWVDPMSFELDDSGKVSGE